VTTRRSLEPIRLGTLEVRNRVAQSATVTNLGRNDAVTDAMVAFYAERARGGVGLIVTEGLSVHPTSLPNTTAPLAYDESLVPGFTKLASAVHEHGAAILGQIWHVGRQALWNPGLIPWAPSGTRDPYSGTTPHVMTDAEILEVVEGFATSAVNLRRAGFDGVELHGAHGYLITQFMSPLSNQRTDRWGGSVENRARFALEIIRACRRACGPDFVVGLKMEAHEYIEGGLTLEDSQELVSHIVATEAPDYISTGQGNFSPSLEKHVPDMHFGERPFVHLPRGIREVAQGVPVMAVTRVSDLDTADDLIEDGTADLVGMTRALLADAHLVRKAAAGQTPRPCIYCNVCWEYIHTGRVVACVYGPDTGREAEVPVVVPVSEPVDVHIVGGGPAGLEVARVGLDYGHAVTVHEKDSELGGRIRRESRVPGREIYAEAADWLEDQVRSAGAVIATGSEIGAEEVSGLGDLVVVATGAVPQVAPVPGAETVLALDGLLERDDETPLGGPIVIIDEIESEPVYGVAEELARRGHQVTVLTRRAAIGRRVSYISLIGVLRRLDERGVTVQTLAVPRAVEDGRLVVAHSFSGRTYPLGPVGTIVRAGPYEVPAGTLAGDVTVGDASGPRELLAVVREANAAAHRVFSRVRASEAAAA
jgi:2,4-dienoyl-CoA reductase-like NADH-dependent reductase (Old Yellow Enzyme family)